MILLFFAIFSNCFVDYKMTNKTPELFFWPFSLFRPTVQVQKQGPRDEGLVGQAYPGEPVDVAARSVEVERVAGVGPVVPVAEVVHTEE